MSFYFSTRGFPASVNPWFYHDNFDICADFCFWVLEADGLRVPPFDSHAEGDGTLRAAGLDAENWCIWMTDVISEHSRRKQQYRQNHSQHLHKKQEAMQMVKEFPENQASEEYQQALHDVLLETSIEQLQSFTAKPFLPLDFWNGDAAVAERLGEMWEKYRVVGHRDLRGRKRWEEHEKGAKIPLGPPEDPYKTWGIIPSEESKRIPDLWTELKPYHTRLDGLVIHFIKYPQQIEYLIPPISAIVTVAEETYDEENIHARVLQVAEALAALKASEPGNEHI